MAAFVRVLASNWAVDDGALVGAAADQVHIVVRLHLEGQAATVDLGQAGVHGDLLAGWGGDGVAEAGGEPLGHLLELRRLRVQRRNGLGGRNLARSAGALGRRAASPSSGRLLPLLAQRAEVQRVALADQLHAEAGVVLLRRQLKAGLHVDASGGGERVVGPQHHPLVPRVAGEPHALLDQPFAEPLAAARAEQRALVADALAEHPTDLPELVHRLWAWLAADEQRHVTRLFFDAFTRSLTTAGDSPWADFARTSVDDWQDMLTRAALDAGQDQRSTTAHATLYLALLRGLLLDLHATGDRPRLDAAVQSLLAAPDR